MPFNTFGHISIVSWILFGATPTGAGETPNPCEAQLTPALECLAHPEYSGDQRIRCSGAIDAAAICRYSMRQNHPELKPLQIQGHQVAWLKRELEAMRKGQQVCSNPKAVCDADRKNLIDKRVKELPLLIKQEESLLRQFQ